MSPTRRFGGSEGAIGVGNKRVSSLWRSAVAKIAEQPAEKIEPRYRVRLAIYYGSEQQELMANYSVNMNSGGIFIETNRILPVDTPLMVEFMLPGKKGKLIACKARVAWTNEPGDRKSPHLPAGMGLQFLGLSLDDIHAIRDFLEIGELSPTW
jgi:uncharacterized protein (TIGR02266 family)